MAFSTITNLDVATPGPDWQGSMLWAVNKEREGRAAPLTQCAALTRAITKPWQIKLKPI